MDFYYFISLDSFLIANNILILSLHGTRSAGGALYQLWRLISCERNQIRNHPFFWK